MAPTADYSKRDKNFKTLMNCFWKNSIFPKNIRKVIPECLKTFLLSESIKTNQSENGMRTSREQHKSAPCLRLKNSKSTSECQEFSFTVPEKPKRWNPKGALKGETNLISSCGLKKKVTSIVVFHFMKRPTKTEVASR